MSDLLQCYIKIKERLLNLEIRRLQEEIESLKRAHKNVCSGNYDSAVRDLEKIGVVLGEWGAYGGASLLLKFLIKKRIDKYDVGETWSLFEYEFTPDRYKDHDYLITQSIESISDLFRVIREVERSEVLTELDRLHIYLDVKEKLEWLVRDLERLIVPDAVRKHILDEIKSWTEWTDEEERRIEKCVENGEFFELIQIIRAKTLELSDAISKRHKTDLNAAKIISSKLGVRDKLDFNECKNLILSVDNLSDLKGIGNLVGLYSEINPNEIGDLFSIYNQKRWEIVDRLKNMGYDGWKKLIEETNDPEELVICYFELCYDDKLSESNRETLWSVIEEKLGLQH